MAKCPASKRHIYLAAAFITSIFAFLMTVTAVAPVSQSSLSAQVGDQDALCRALDKKMQKCEKKAESCRRKIDVRKTSCEKRMDKKAQACEKRSEKAYNFCMRRAKEDEAKKQACEDNREAASLACSETYEAAAADCDALEEGLIDCDEAREMCVATAIEAFEDANDISYDDC